MSKAPSESTQFNGNTVKALLAKTEHYDADERFMATKDVMEQLRLVSGPLDGALQLPLRNAILRLLDDKNSDVSTMAVKCLSQLCQKFAQEHIAFVVDKLADMIVDPSKEASRDIVTDGLQTLIASVDDAAGTIMAPKLVQSLLRGLTHTEKRDEVDCEMACLTIVKNLLHRFGNEVTEHHGAIVAALTGLLSHPNESVRRRTAVTLGPLVTVLDDTLFESLMGTLIAQLQSSSTPSVGTYIQSISAVCRSAGVRVGPYLPQIVPRLEKLCLTASAGGKQKRDDEEEDEAQLELWEQSLQALEAITLRCPNKVTPYVPNIVRLATQLSTFDPLYSYEDAHADADADMAKGKPNAKAAEEGWGDDAGDEGWGDEGDAEMNGDGGDGWDDDEAATAAVATASSDGSWKVRRAAVGLLAAFIRARSDILKSYYNDICDHLVSRFKERDVAVKEEILLCTRDLLRESVVSAKGAAAAASAASSGAGHGSQDAEMDEAAPMAPSFLRTRSSYETLDTKLPEIVHACEKLFRSGASGSGSGALDSRTQRAIFALLQELVRVRNGGLQEYLATLVPPILANITQSKQTKEAEASADALKLLKSIVSLHTFDALQPFLPAMVQVLCATVSSGLESLKADALGVVAALAKVTSGHGERELARSLYSVTFDEFLQKDVPLAIKLASISALAAILSYLEAELDRDAVSKECVPVMLERLRNDSTVQPMLRALTRIANLSDTLDYALIIAHSGEIMQLCRKKTHHVKNDTVRCMEAILRRSASSKAKRPGAATFSEAQIQAMLQEVAGLLSDSDLHLAHLVLDLASTTLSIGSAAAAELIPRTVLPAAISLMTSPRLQGVALSSLIRFLQSCVTYSSRAAKPASPLGYNNLLGMLLQQVQGSTAAAAGGAQLPKSAYMAIAQCVAGTTERASDAQANETVSKFVSEIVQRSELDANSQIALLVLGEMGRRRDLTAHAGLESACLKAFDSKDELVRSAAAFALGNISVGNLDKSLPTLLGLIKAKLQASSSAAAGAGAGSAAHHGYLLFSSLKEIILSYSGDAKGLGEFRRHVAAIMPLLLANVGHDNEATRAMVAECLGRLLVVDPARVMAPLERLVADARAPVRVCAVIALRFCLHPLMDTGALERHLGQFIGPLLSDADLDVRRHALLTVNAVARFNIAALPRDALYAVILPALYAETTVKEELKREVDYAAFKLIVDDGKPLRRAAYQTLQTLLEVAPQRIDLPEFIAAVKKGIRDDGDIQMLAYQIFIELAKFHGSAMLEVIDQLPKIIMDSVKKYIAEAKSKEPESAQEVLRSIVRALLVFNQIPGVELCAQYAHFFKQVQATSVMQALIREATGTA